MAKKTLLDEIIESIKGIDGQLINQSGTTEQMISDLNYKVVAPAKSAADSAVSAADAAVASAQVTSDAVSAIASATAEAKAGANEAMSRALSAWDVATGAKEAVTDFDPLLKSAQSDAGKALTQIADTANALSDAKTEFGSDVAVAKELANTAQTTANSAVESASENARELASQANALSDAKKAMDSDVASAKGLANTAQATADSAIKSAASVASDLTAVASQAKSNADGITKVTSDVGLLQTTVADNSGDISTIQETAKQIQQAVSDNAGNITTAKQTADSAIAVASDAKSNATVAVQTASGASVTAENAQSNATTAMVTANGAVTKASDAKSNATIAVQTASEASVTATNAQGDASIAKQTASDASIQIKNAQGDISNLQTRAGKIEASVATNSGAIANIQVTANELKASVSDNAGNITTAKQTADSAVTVASDARSNATVAIQTASQASITASSASGQAASAVITANGAMTTASNAKSDATVAIQTASGASLTATNAQSDATIAKQTASEAIVQASNADSDFAQISIRANKIEANVATNSGAIASVQQTANGLTTTVADIKANGGGVNLANGTTSEDQSSGDASQTTGWVVPTIATFDNPQAGQQYTISVNAKANGGSWTIQVWDGTSPAQRISNVYVQPVSITQEQKITATITWPSSSNKYLLVQLINSNDGGQIVWNSAMIEEGAVAHTWSPAPDDLQNQFTQTKESIDGIATTINDPKTGLNATYQTAQGNATTISNVKGDVTQLQSTANGLTSRVGSLESKTATQQTTIDQNKAAIALKADQTTVDTLKGTVNQNTATLKTQADQINSKVTSSDVTGMLTGYATQTYTQSLVTQKADQWNLNLTSLKTDVNAIKTTGGGVNLVGDSEAEFSGKAYNFHYYSLASLTALTPGKTYTVSFSAKVDDKAVNYQQDLFVYIYTPSWSWVMPANAPISTDYQRVTQTFTVPEGITDVNSIMVYLSHPTINGNSDPSSDKSDDAGTGYIKEFMLEEGTVAHDWSPAPSDMATVTSVTNLSATVDGIKSTVATKADQSTVTQLSNALQSKVESSTYTSAINQLSNDINLRVKSADLISQINLQAGTSLIQSDKLVLDAGTTVFTGEAFIPSAAISSISADKVKIGNTSLFSSDGTFNLINGSGSTASSSIKLTTGIMEGVSQPLTQLSNGTNTHALEVGEEGINVTPTIFFNDYPDEAKDTGWLGFSRHETAELQFHTYDDTKELFRIACAARVNHDLHVDGKLWQGGLSISSGNSIWSGSDYLAIGSNVTGTYTGIWAKSFSQLSTLSSKTNIETVDPKDALDLVNKTDIRSYQYKSDVALGNTKRYTSLIIDDVNDVSQYYAPDEFTNEERTGRDDGSAVGYLFLAVQELTRRIKTLEEKLNG